MSRYFDIQVGRILALDYGVKRTGAAVSDPLRIIAGGLDTVATSRLHEWLSDYMSREAVDIIVVGLPLQSDGTPSDTGPAADRLAAELQRRYPHVKVARWDERYTSVLAHRAMREGGMKKMQRRDKAAADRVSATIILQSYMESMQYRTDSSSQTKHTEK